MLIPPLRRVLVRLACGEDTRLPVPRADDVEADREAGGGESTGDARSRLLGQVERIGERRPARPASDGQPGGTSSPASNAGMGSVGVTNRSYRS